MNEFDALWDRMTDEDRLVFSKLKIWSAAPQVKADDMDGNIMTALTRISRDEVHNIQRIQARISIVANGGKDI